MKLFFGWVLFLGLSVGIAKAQVPMGSFRGAEEACVPATLDSMGSAKGSGVSPIQDCVAKATEDFVNHSQAWFSLVPQNTKAEMIHHWYTWDPKYVSYEDVLKEASVDEVMFRVTGQGEVKTRDSNAGNIFFFEGTVKVNFENKNGVTRCYLSNTPVSPTTNIAVAPYCRQIDLSYSDSKSTFANKVLISSGYFLPKRE